MHNNYNYSSAVNDAQAHLIIVSFLVPKLRVILSISYELLLGPLNLTDMATQRTPPISQL